RLGHLFPFDEQMLGVEPVSRERFSRGAYTLRDFVLVVRESEVDSASVNVQRFTEILHGHRGAFNVTAGAARADFRFPEMFTGLGRFPERKVPRALFFVTIVVHSRAGLSFGQINFGKIAVCWKFSDRKSTSLNS